MHQIWHEHALLWIMVSIVKLFVHAVNLGNLLTVVWSHQAWFLITVSNTWLFVTCILIEQVGLPWICMHWVLNNIPGLMISRGPRLLSTIKRAIMLCVLPSWHIQSWNLACWIRVDDKHVKGSILSTSTAIFSMSKLQLIMWAFPFSLASADLSTVISAMPACPQGPQGLTYICIP